MLSPFAKSFEELLNGILTDYQNQVDSQGNPIDVSKGSLAFIKAACMASVAWGMHQAIAWTGDQIFPDTASVENLYHHGAVDGLAPLAGESAADYLTRVQLFETKPLAGGNRYDYVKWALDMAGVAKAWCYPLARGNGTVDVVITADPATGSEIPDEDVLAAVKTYIDGLRPVGPGDDAVHVIAPIVDDVDVTMTNLDGADPAAIAADITAYLKTFIPNQPLYMAQLKALAINRGAVNPTLLAPAADVMPPSYHMIRPGVVNVAA
jgi:uncharacterized phage protein gp47/JayE